MKRSLTTAVLLLATGFGLSVVPAFQNNEKQRVRSKSPHGAAQDLPSESITEITLEYQAGGWGAHPAYKVTLRKNGRATYVGAGLMRLEGKYKGEIEQDDFRQLAEFFVEESFFELPEYDEKAPRISHSEKLIIQVVHRGGSKVVGDFNKEGPPKMAAFEMIINRMIRKIGWEIDYRQ